MFTILYFFCLCLPVLYLFRVRNRKLMTRINFTLYFFFRLCVFDNAFLYCIVCAPTSRTKQWPSISFKYLVQYCPQRAMTYSYWVSIVANVRISVTGCLDHKFKRSNTLMAKCSKARDLYMASWYRQLWCTELALIFYTTLCGRFANLLQTLPLHKSWLSDQ